MTISFSQLGNLGHVGNQMFQYAALRGIASNCGYEWAVPAQYEFGKNYAMRSSIYDIFNLPSITLLRTVLPGNPVLSEKYFHFDEDLFNNCPDSVDLNGYFQSYRYFDHIRDELLKEFSFKSNSLCQSKDSVVIHVRRGDYVGQPGFHPLCDLEYYKKAMEVFGDENFIVVSDDPDWCSQQDVFLRCKIAINRSVADDLHTMINAKGNIIANSSFSWWGAYLNNNPNKKVIAPQRWFGEQLSQHDTKDLIPEEWIKL